MINRTCKNCGKEFKTYKCCIERGKRLGREEGIFCSRSCRSSGKFHPKYNGGNIEVKRICEQCKKTYITTVTVMRQRQRKYCSLQCSGKARPALKGWTMRGGRRVLYLPNHPKAHNNYYPEHRYIVEQNIRRILGADEHVHHINRDKNDNRLENLVVLTASEHSKEHNRDKHIAAKKYWTAERRKEFGLKVSAYRKNHYWSNRENRKVAL